MTQNRCAYVLMQTGVVDIVSFKSQDGEDGYGGVQRCGTVYQSYYNSIPLTVVSNRHRTESQASPNFTAVIGATYFLPLCIIAGESYETSKGHRKREEDLGGGVQPHLRVLQCLPLK